jgi:hypothetical protein
VALEARNRDACAIGVELRSLDDMLEADLRARLEIDPSDVVALASLKGIYRSSDRWMEWVECQQTLIDLESEVER